MTLTREVNNRNLPQLKPARDSRTLKIGVIGCGYWGPKLARNFQEIPGSSLTMESKLWSKIAPLPTWQRPLDPRQSRLLYLEPQSAGRLRAGRRHGYGWPRHCS